MTNVAYRIVFSGPPIPLARPRLSRYGVYDPQKPLKKKVIIDLLRQKESWQKIDGAIGILFEFRMPIPKCSKKKQGEHLKAYHIKRPDTSNMIKFYEDCLQGYVFDDDSQIVEITARKVNSMNPETIIHIWRQNERL